MTSFVRRAWIPTVLLIVLALGTFTVSLLYGLFGSSMHVPDSVGADATIQFNPKRVTYEVSGPAGTVATVNCLDADTQPQKVDDVTLPCPLTLVTTLTAVSANMVAQRNTDNISFRITVNGLLRDEHWMP